MIYQVFSVVQNSDGGQPMSVRNLIRGFTIFLGIVSLLAASLGIFLFFVKNDWYFIYGAFYAALGGLFLISLGVRGGSVKEILARRTQYLEVSGILLISSVWEFIFSINGTNAGSSVVSILLGLFGICVLIATLKKFE